VIVKICGLRDAESARGAAEAGADLLGLVFAPSKRQLSTAAAAAIVAALRAEPAARGARIVGLFVNEQPATINALIQQVGLDLVQLSGDEAVAVARNLIRPVIKTLRLDGSAREQAWIDGTDAALLLVDGHRPGSYGGTGTLADWRKAAQLARRRRVLLAGGLRPENVGTAVAQVAPAGVDVSSGVETGGVKDLHKVRAFIAAARHEAILGARF
jgi:phosphoribosylanthranilate isomerase